MQSAELSAAGDPAVWGGVGAAWRVAQGSANAQGCEQGWGRHAVTAEACCNAGAGLLGR